MDGFERLISLMSSLTRRPSVPLRSISNAMPACDDGSLETSNISHPLSRKEKARGAGETRIPPRVAQAQTVPSVNYYVSSPRRNSMCSTPLPTRTGNLRFRRNGIFDSCSAFAVVKIMGNPAKRRIFPPQTTLPLYSIFVQSQRRKPIFSPQNPYFATIFSENPYKTHTTFRPPNHRNSAQNPKIPLPDARNAIFCREKREKSRFSRIFLRKTGNYPAALPKTPEIAGKCGKSVRNPGQSRKTATSALCNVFFRDKKTIRCAFCAKRTQPNNVGINSNNYELLGRVDTIDFSGRIASKLSLGGCVEWF